MTKDDLIRAQLGVDVAVAELNAAWAHYGAYLETAQRCVEEITNAMTQVAEKTRILIDVVKEVRES